MMKLLLFTYRTESFRSYWSPALSALPTLPLAYDDVRCTEVDSLTRKDIWDCQVTAANNKCGGPTQAAGVACGPLPKAVVPGKWNTREPLL